MIDRAAIAREAMRAAFQVRRSLVISREGPVNPFEVANSLGIDVWFTNTPSLEGMFTRTDEARIFLPCLNHRPLGRLCFSCAHELGHAQLGHGNRIDEYVESRVSAKDPEEVAADVFASTLLMPRTAVLESFRVRGLEPTGASAIHALSVAFELCVGFETLVKHLHWGLDVIDRKTMERLLKSTPKSIRQGVFGSGCPSVVVPIDAAWRSSAVDLEVGHAIALPRGAAPKEYLASHLELIERASDWDLFSAKRQGIVPVERGSTSTLIRIAHSGFEGPWRYRYLEDGDKP